MHGLIGQTIGGYRIMSQVGKGGMATVYKAYQPSLDRYVAVKVMPPYYAAQDDTFLKRFRREAKAIANLRHPNILMVIDYGEENETTYLVMEFVEAGTLSELLGRPMAPARMSGLIDQVAGALDYAHKQGVVHRDIKPSNVLLSKPDWPLLTDFGLAKIVGGSQLTQSGTIAGTPAYMSPEQGQGEKVDARSDIYSLGIVLYEMATGVVPFSAETPMAVVVKHIIDPLPMPRSKNPDLPEGIELVILKALSKEPADRYQEVTELAEALTETVGALPAEVAQSEPAPAAQETTLEQPAKEAMPAAVVSASEEAGVVAEAGPEPDAEGVGETQPKRWGRGRIAAAAGAGLLVLAVIAVAVSQIGGPGAIEDTRTVEQLIADGRAEVDRGDPSSAIDAFELAIEQKPGNPELYFDLARAYAIEGDEQAAIQSIQQGIEAAPNEAWVHENAGYTLYDIGLFEQAADEFRNALELDPDAYWLYFNIADGYSAAGQTERAASVLFEGMEHPSIGSNPDELDSMGWYFLSLEMVDEAEQAFNRAIETAPDFPSPWEGLAEVAYRRGDISAGLAALEAGIETFADHAPFYETAGWWYWEVGELDRADSSFQRAIELDPDNNAAVSALANLMRETGREHEAEELMRQALEEHPDVPEFYAELASLLMSMGGHTEAIGLYERAIELAPEEAWLRAELGQVYTDLGDRGLARELLGEASALNPGDPWLDDFIGWAYMSLGDCEQAIEHFERALSLDPTVDSSRDGLRDCRG